MLLALDRTAVLHDWVTMNVSIDPVWLRGAFALVGAVALVLLAPRLGARARVVAVTAWVLLVIGPIIETVATETLPPAAAESLAMNLVIATELALRTMAGALLVFAFLDTMRSPAPSRPTSASRSWTGLGRTTGQAGAPDFRKPGSAPAAGFEIGAGAPGDRVIPS